MRLGSALTRPSGHWETPLSSCTATRVVELLLGAKEGLYFREIMQILKVQQATLSWSLGQLTKSGHVIRSGTRSRPYFTATGLPPPKDGRGEHPKSRAALTWLNGIQAMNKREMPPEPAPPIHQSALAQALAWEPRQ